MRGPFPDTPVVHRPAKHSNDNGPVADLADDPAELAQDSLREVSETARKVLALHADGMWHAPRPELLGLTVGQYALTVTQLEFKRMLEKGFMGYRITRMGQLTLERSRAQR